MGWTDDDDEDILVDLEAIDASIAARQNRAANHSDDKDDGSAMVERLVDDEAEADGEEGDDESEAEEDSDDKKSAVTAEEKEETGNKSQTALLYMVHQMATEVGKETGMQFSKQMLSLVRDVVYDHVQSVGADMELFAKHAKRTVVNLEDVMLGVRNNHSLVVQHIHTSAHCTRYGTRTMEGADCSVRRLLSQQKAALDDFQHQHNIGVGKKQNKKRKKAVSEQQEGGQEEAAEEHERSKRGSANTKRGKRTTK